MPRKKPVDAPPVIAKTKPKAAVDAAGVVGKPRRFTPLSYVSRRRRIRAQRTVARNRLPSSFVVMARAIRSLTSHWEVYSGILATYAVVNLILVGGFSSQGSIGQLESNINDVFSGQLDKLATGLTVFAFFVQSGSTVASGVASAYQTILLFVISLTIVWALRQFHGGNKIRIRDAFYNGSYPLVPVFLVLLMVFVHLLPAVFGGFLLNSVVLGGIAAAGWQQALASLVCAVLFIWTFYLVSASLFALYIATLPDMTPLAALRSAKEIVRHRRAMVLRKLLFLPICLLLVAAMLMVPIALFATTATAPLFFLLSVLCVPLVHAYMYSLYRSLIDA